MNKYENELIKKKEERNKAIRSLRRRIQKNLDMLSLYSDWMKFGKYVERENEFYKGTHPEFHTWCPFHGDFREDESQYDFIINVDKNSYRYGDWECTVCEESGDIFRFYRVLYDLNIERSLKRLAKLANIKFPDDVAKAFEHRRNKTKHFSSKESRKEFIKKLKIDYRMYYYRYMMQNKRTDDGNILTICPFHSEPMRSFSPLQGDTVYYIPKTLKIDMDDGLCKCSVCGKESDVIEFATEILDAGDETILEVMRMKKFQRPDPRLFNIVDL